MALTAALDLRRTLLPCFAGAVPAESRLFAPAPPSSRRSPTLRLCSVLSSPCSGLLSQSPALPRTSNAGSEDVLLRTGASLNMAVFTTRIGFLSALRSARFWSRLSCARSRRAAASSARALATARGTLSKRNAGPFLGLAEDAAKCSAPGRRAPKKSDIPQAPSQFLRAAPREREDRQRRLALELARRSQGFVEWGSSLGPVLQQRLQVALEPTRFRAPRPLQQAPHEARGRTDTRRADLDVVRKIWRKKNKGRELAIVYWLVDAS